MRPWPNFTVLFHRLLPLLPVVLLGTNEVSAQPVSVLGKGLVSRPGFIGPGPNRGLDCGPGAGWHYYGLPSGPTTAFTTVGYGRGGYGTGVGYGYGGFGFPAAVGSFWSNGLSLYGPPIPTYAPIPGSFGGSDAHKIYMNPPVLGFGLNVFGYRSPSPRLATPSVSVSAQGKPVVVLPAPSSQQVCRVEVRVPDAQAEMWINKGKTTSTGTERSFESPELAEGKEYEYEVVSRWMENGEKRAASRKVLVSAGKSILVDFRDEK